MTSKRIEFIEIDLPKCSLEYGVSPCTASVGVTGSEKCFNCFSSCQDTPNYSETAETVRYSVPSTLVRFDLNATPNITVPNISSVNYTPPELMLGESIGVRAKLSVNFSDSRSPDTDASGDKYLSDRNYDPYSQGTYWGKFRARYPSLKDVPLRWIVGTDDQLISNMETRHFVIDSVTGPDTSGRYNITAKDVLKLTDGNQSVAPEITARSTATTFDTSYTGTIDTVPDTDPIAVNAPGFLSLKGQEIVGYSTGFAGPGVVLVNITSRGEFGTEPVDNSSGDDVDYQRLLSYTGDKPSDILYDLLVNYAGIDPSFISLTDWENESDTYINRNYATNIAEPTGVVKLVNEILEQTASTMWWDNQAQLIRWQVLRQPNVSAFTYNDSNTLSGSFSIKDQYDKRVSRVYVYFGQKNPLLKLDELDNFTGRILRTETDSEIPFAGIPAYKTIVSRWIPSQGRDTAERLGDLILQRFSKPPRKLGFRLLRDSGVEVPELGGAYNASNLFLQDFAGRVASLPVQITSLIPSNTKYTVTAEEITFNEVITPDDPNTVPINIDSNLQDVSLRDLYDQIAPEPTAVTVVNVTILSGVIVGSSSTGIPALKSGDWPAGVTLNLTNNGYIVGRGGNGGNGASVTYISETEVTGSPTRNIVSATVGSNGGDAIEDTYGINLTNNGIIGGGGGGAGGTGAAWSLVNDNTDASSGGDTIVKYLAVLNGSGGGGGAGSTSGNGGSSGSRIRTTTNYSFFTLTKEFFVEFPESYNVVGYGGLAGSLTDGGDNQGRIFDNCEFSPSGNLIQNTLINSPTWGGGGDLGQNGQDGDDMTITYGPSAVTDRQSDSVSGASGGLAGNAIVQVGATTNIIVTGDIRGAVI